MNKLTGDEYLDFWRERIAKGPEQVGFAGSAMEEVEKQADYFFSALRAGLPPAEPRTLLEFGSGYGRMLKRFREVCPNTELYGVELCPEAVQRSWKDDKTSLRVGSTVPSEWMASEFDMIVTCTVLQHITDQDIFDDVTCALGISLKKGGRIMMLENVSKPGAAHVRDSDPEDYKDAFPGVIWTAQKPLMWKEEKHVVVFGVRE